MLSKIANQTMSTIEIAELTGKLKKNIHKDIKDQILKNLYNYQDGSDFNHVDIKGIFIILDDRGYWKEVLLDRYHTDILMSGYEIKYRAAIIKRWHELEATKLESPVDTSLNLPLMANDLEAAHKMALIFGLEGNQAKLKADKCVKEIHNVSPMKLLGIDLPSPVQARLMTPTEIGKELGLSPQMVNKLLHAHGLQTRGGDNRWLVTATGKQYSQLLDVGKDHSNGTPVQQLKWYDTVIDVLRN